MINPRLLPVVVPTPALEFRLHTWYNENSVNRIYRTIAAYIRAAANYRTIRKLNKKRLPGLCRRRRYIHIALCNCRPLKLKRGQVYGPHKRRNSRKDKE